ncbi:Coiled-coil domain-containing protein [Verticillium dahliae VDG1]|nr:Coiled-coil domain-containing protein [Verticillium dahliae VDG1]
MASLNDSTVASALGLPVHPFHPLDAIVNDYVENTMSTLTILTIFASTCVAILLPTLLLIRRLRPNLSTGDVSTAMWFIVSGSIHLGLEGYFSINSARMGPSLTVLGQLWKEYALSDSRYLTQDSFVVCMETVTAFVWGPLCFLCAAAILYGVVLYYATFEYDNVVWGRDYSRPENYYYWGYYVFLNAFWFFIPVTLILRSAVASTRAIAAVQRLEAKAGKKN